MKSELHMGQSAGVELVRPSKGVSDKLAAKGRFHVEHWRNGVKINEFDVSNFITDEGRTKLLEVMFHNGTKLTAWWMGLVSASSFTSYGQGDSYAQLAGTNAWREFQDYTDNLNGGNAGTRPTWGAGAVGVVSHVASTTNAAAAVFDITSGNTVKGLFIVGGTASPGSQTKGDTASSDGVLWAAAAFTAGDVAVLNGDQLKVTYTVTA
jgi:hypothetical protein